MDELKTPIEWSKIDGIVIMDPDGWRNDGKSFYEPITRAEFDERTWVSTIMHTRRES